MTMFEDTFRSTIYIALKQGLGSKDEFLQMAGKAYDTAYADYLEAQHRILREGLRELLYDCLNDFYTEKEAQAIWDVLGKTDGANLVNDIVDCIMTDIQLIRNLRVTENLARAPGKGKAESTNEKGKPDLKGMANCDKQKLDKDLWTMLNSGTGIKINVDEDFFKNGWLVYRDSKDSKEDKK